MKRRSNNEVLDNFVTVVIRGNAESIKAIAVVAVEGYELVETQERWRGGDEIRRPAET